jgi:hypothetical protein
MTWLLELELAYNEAIEYKLLEVQGLNAHYAFMFIIVEFDLSFSYN